MDFLSIPTLAGELATLEPMAIEHTEDLAEAVGENDLYKAWYTRLPSPAGMAEEAAKQRSAHVNPGPLRHIRLRFPEHLTGDGRDLPFAGDEEAEEVHQRIALRPAEVDVRHQTGD